MASERLEEAIADGMSMYDALQDASQSGDAFKNRYEVSKYGS